MAANLTIASKDKNGRDNLRVVGKSTDGKEVISGEDIFKLIDTHGIPLDFIIDSLQEINCLVDWYGFVTNMSWKKKTLLARLKDTSLQNADEVIEKINAVFV
jgi:alanyl-tRNA synthetase